MGVCYFWTIGLAMTLAGFQTPMDNPDVAILNKTPPIAGKSYRCAEMIRVVNHLRRLGKNKSLAVLRDYLASEGQFERFDNNGEVLIICRLLFVNPKGWAPPGLGDPAPATNQDVEKHFPLFPIALSDNVPFLLVYGYTIAGVPELAKDCLELCKRFSIIKRDYPLEGYEKSARSLTQMDSFRQLYKTEADRQEMADLILRQAKKVKAEDR